jgi:hypothetical protein
LLAVGAGILDGGPLLNALHAKDMPAVDYALVLLEVLMAYNALKDRLLVKINTLLHLFLVMFVGKVLFRLIFVSELIIRSFFLCSVFYDHILSLQNCTPRMLLLSNDGGVFSTSCSLERQR